MQRINWTRVILGGLLAGVVINIVEYLVNGLWLADLWAADMKALGQPGDISPFAYVVFNVWGFLIGIFAVWLYVTIRPRFGAGPRTAVIAGIATWVPGSLLASLAPIALHLFARRLFGIGVACELVGLVLATLAGARVYKEG